MTRKLRPRSIYDVFGLLALIVAVGGTSAYAANTVFSTDIVDGEVKSIDIGQNEIGSADVKDNSLNTFDVHSFLGADVVDGSLTGADVQDNSLQFNDIGSQSVGSDEVVNDSLLQSDIRAGAVTGDEVLDNSLTGADINESALNLPSRARFVSVSGFDSRVAETQVPEGNYLVYIAANQRTEVNDGTGKRVSCELYSRAAGQADPGDFIGDAKTIDRTSLANPNDPRTATFENLSTMGGAAVGPGGATIYALCGKEGASRSYFTGAFWVIQIGGFGF